MPAPRGAGAGAGAGRAEVEREEQAVNRKKSRRSKKKSTKKKGGGGSGGGGGGAEESGANGISINLFSEVRAGVLVLRATLLSCHVSVHRSDILNAVLAPTLSSPQTP